MKGCYWLRIKNQGKVKKSRYEFVCEGKFLIKIYICPKISVNKYCFTII